MKSFAGVKQDNYSPKKFYRLRSIIWTSCLVARVFLVSQEKKREREIQKEDI